jgi:NADH-quinone oxidoreductase subunit H
VNETLIVIGRILAALGLMLANGVVLIYMLRKVLGHLHLRLGPMHVGWHGLAQTLMDVLKLLTKEDPTPRRVDKALFFIAPAAVFVPSLMAYAAIAFSPTWKITNLDTGLLYTFAVMSLVPIGLLMAGWSSANKWALLGGMRSAAQQIAYEVPMLLAALPIVMIAGTLNLGLIVEAQAGYVFGFVPKWFIIWQFPAFLLFLVAGLVELNQTPFDLSEAESELVAGWASEYSAMKFGLLFLAEFSGLFIMSALIVTLFLGGWQVPYMPIWWYEPISPIIFMLKTYFVIFCFMWIRGTFPRVRIDKLMETGWKILIPASLGWIMVTGVILKVLEAWRGVG